MNMTTLQQGRPADTTGRLPVEIACYDLLDKLGIEYGRVDHEEAATLESCEAVDVALVTVICKNLFRCGKRRIYGHFATTLVQISCNITFCTEIHQRHLRTIPRKYILFLTGDFFYYFSSCICCESGKDFI